MRTPSRIRRYGWATAGFIAIYKSLEWISGAGAIVTGWSALEKYFPQLRTLPSWLGLVVIACLALLLTVVGFRAYVRYRLKDVNFPESWGAAKGRFANDDKLKFDYVRDPIDVAQLAATEDYGDKGQTDIAVATDWWKAYKYGNTLARYDGKIIGGIDIWPLTRKAYDMILEGSLGDLDLRPRHFPRRRSKNGSYWYIGSVSLAQIWRLGEHRRELLLRLCVNAMQSWLNRDPVFPATFVAIAWTIQGRNMLIRQKFRFFPRPAGAPIDDPTYTRTFETREKFEVFLEKQKSRLA